MSVPGRKIILYGNGDDDEEYIKDIAVPSDASSANYILARGTFALCQGGGWREKKKKR